MKSLVALGSVLIVSGFLHAAQPAQKVALRKAYYEHVTRSYNQDLEARNWLKRQERRWAARDYEFLQEYFRKNKIDRFMELKKSSPFHFEFFDGEIKRGEMRILDDDSVKVNDYQISFEGKRSIKERMEYIERVLNRKTSFSKEFLRMWMIPDAVAEATVSANESQRAQLNASILRFFEDSKEDVLPWRSDTAAPASRDLAYSQMVRTGDVAAIRYRCSYGEDESLPKGIRGHYSLNSELDRPRLIESEKVETGPFGKKSYAVRTVKMTRLKPGKTGIEGGRVSVEDEVSVVLSVYGDPTRGQKTVLKADTWVNGELKASIPADQFLKNEKWKNSVAHDRNQDTRYFDKEVVASALVRCCSPADSSASLRLEKEATCFDKAPRSGSGLGRKPSDSTAQPKRNTQ